MLRIVLALGLVATASPVLAGNTDWGIRAVTGEKVTPKVVDAPHERIVVPPAKAYVDPYLPQAQSAVSGGGGSTGFNMGGVASIGGRYGRVTSTYRSPQHNRAVGGVANSYHLRGRAIDIARRPGISHWQIAAALRSAGYNLLESLDEGDHSHFAFGNPGEVKRRSIPITPRAKIVLAKADGETQWRIVFAPSGGGN